MDNPLAVVKRVPKWAWVASAGIAGGIVFYRYRTKGTAPAAASADQTATADAGQTYSPIGGYVTSPMDETQGASDLAPAASGIPLDQLPDLIGAIGGIQSASQPAPVSAVDLLESILPYVGGGAPASTATQSAPAPAAAAPRAPNPTPAAKPCPTQYPFRDGPTGDCYQVTCATGKGDKKKGRWHIHQNGHDQYVSPTC